MTNCELKVIRNNIQLCNIGGTVHLTWPSDTVFNVFIMRSDSLAHTKWYKGVILLLRKLIVQIRGECIVCNIWDAITFP